MLQSNPKLAFRTLVVQSFSLSFEKDDRQIDQLFRRNGGFILDSGRVHRRRGRHPRALLYSPHIAVDGPYTPKYPQPHIAGTPPQKFSLYKACRDDSVINPLPKRHCAWSLSSVQAVLANAFTHVSVLRQAPLLQDNASPPFAVPEAVNAAHGPFQQRTKSAHFAIDRIFPLDIGRDSEAVYFRMARTGSGGMEGKNGKSYLCYLSPVDGSRLDDAMIYTPLLNEAQRYNQYFGECSGAHFQGIRRNASDIVEMAPAINAYARDVAGMKPRGLVNGMMPL